MYAANALLFTSRSEGSPNAVKEAMAAGLPIVSTPVGDVSERLAGVEGCWIEQPEPTKLGGALVKAVAHGRSPAARAAVAEISLGRAAERILSIYRTVVRECAR
jgi:glycosyltransferase involved in cell wall biosynthesis